MSNMIIKGPAMIPGVQDTTEDRPHTEEEIQNAAYGFIKNYGIVDVQHSFKKQADLVESFITPETVNFNGKDYPPGTWFITSSVTDPEIQEAIRNGELTGYSVGAYPEQEYDELKRFGITKALGKNRFDNVEPGKWFAFAVSIVDIPAQPNAVFKVFEESEFIKKSLRDDTMSKEQKENENAVFGVMGKLIDALITKSTTEEEKVIEKENPPADTGNFVTKDDLAALKDEIKQMIAEAVGVNKEAPEEEEEESESEEEKEEETTEEDEKKEEDKVITKSLPVDQTKKPAKSFNSQIGRDAFGNKIKQ